MNKKVLVISTSPRKNGNLEILADEFIKGAIDGNLLEKMFFNSTEEEITLKYKDEIISEILAPNEIGVEIVRDGNNFIFSEISRRNGLEVFGLYLWHNRYCRFQPATQ